VGDGGRRRDGKPKGGNCGNGCSAYLLMALSFEWKESAGIACAMKGK
jgi:hypothetical protein